MATLVLMPGTMSRGRRRLGRSVTRGRDRDFQKSWIHALLVFLVCAKIFGLIVLFDPLAIQTFDLAKALYSRALEWLIVGVLLLSIIRFGVGVLPRARLHMAVGLFVFAALVATVLAENRYIALFGDYTRYDGLT